MSDWIEVTSIEEIGIIGSEILVWDGCECHIDYVDVFAGNGHYYMANDTRPTHWMPLPSGPKTNEVQDDR